MAAGLSANGTTLVSKVFTVVNAGASYTPATLDLASGPFAVTAGQRYSLVVSEGTNNSDQTIYRTALTATYS